MRHPDPRGTGARGSSDTGFSLAGDIQVSNIPEAPLQAIPSTDAEALIWGEALPTGSHLAETRALWWRQAALGHRLPAEIGIITIDGGAK